VACPTKLEGLKGIDFSQFAQPQLDQIATRLNTRPGVSTLPCGCSALGCRTAPGDLDNYVRIDDEHT